MSQIDDIYNSLIYKDDFINPNNFHTNTSSNPIYTTNPIIYKPNSDYQIESYHQLYANLVTTRSVVGTEGKGKFDGYNSSGSEKHLIVDFSGGQSWWENWHGYFAAAVEKKSNISSQYTFTQWVYFGGYADIHIFANCSTDPIFISNQPHFDISNYFPTFYQWYLIGAIVEYVSSTKIKFNFFSYRPKTKNFILSPTMEIENQNFTHYCFFWTPKYISSSSDPLTGSMNRAVNTAEMKIYNKALTESDIRLLGDYTIIISK